VAAKPGGGLPQLQSETFGSVNLGYGDLFVAALLGAGLARAPARQGRAALVTLACAALFDLLFLTVSELPATVPVALALVIDTAHPDSFRLPRARAGVSVLGVAGRRRRARFLRQ
jgi:hypothetical protein